MAIDNENVIPTTGGTCPDYCKVYNKATVSYGYVIDGEANTNTAESGIVPTCVQPSKITDFTVLKIASQKYVKPGDIVDYFVIITNTGNTTLKNFEFKDKIDPKTTYADTVKLYIDGVSKVPVITPPAAPPNDYYKFAFPAGETLLPGKSAIFTFKVQVNAGATGIITNTAYDVKGTDLDGNPVGPKTSTVTLEVKFVELEVIKTASPEPVECGKELTYTITVKNKSPYAANNVLLSDYFDPQFDLAGATVTVPAGVIYVKKANNLLEVNIGTLAASPAQVVITVKGIVRCCC